MGVGEGGKGVQTNNVHSFLLGWLLVNVRPLMYSLSLHWTFHDLTLKNGFHTFLIDQGQLFPMNSNAVSLLFQLESDKKFWYREKGGKWSIKVNISCRKAILPNISIRKYFARCQICGYKFWNDLESNYFLHLFVCFYEKCTHLGQSIFPAEVSCPWCH